MKTDITLYHKNDDDKYIIKHFYNVTWQETLGIDVNKGYDENNNIILRVFAKDNNIKDTSFCVGDFIVKGIIKTQINLQSDLKDTFNILSVNPHLRGSIETQHIKLIAK